MIHIMTRRRVSNATRIRRDITTSRVYVCIHSRVNRNCGLSRLRRRRTRRTSHGSVLGKWGDDLSNVRRIRFAVWTCTRVHDGITWNGFREQWSSVSRYDGTSREYKYRRDTRYQNVRYAIAYKLCAARETETPPHISLSLSPWTYNTEIETYAGAERVLRESNDNCRPLSRPDKTTILQVNAGRRKRSDGSSVRHIATCRDRGGTDGKQYYTWNAHNKWRRRSVIYNYYSTCGGRAGGARPNIYFVARVHRAPERTTPRTTGTVSLRRGGIRAACAEHGTRRDAAICPVVTAAGRVRWLQRDTYRPRTVRRRE